MRQKFVSIPPTPKTRTLDNLREKYTTDTTKTERGKCETRKAHRLFFDEAMISKEFCEVIKKSRKKVRAFS